MTLATISALPEELLTAMKGAQVWASGCPVPLERLSYLSSICYFDFSGKEHNDGELVVLDVVAPLVADIFGILHQKRFPISHLRSMHHYNADDLLSMADNNTSCFCHRPIEGSLIPSMHSFGLAIDLNPVQNPFIIFEPEKENQPTIYPREGWQFINRHNQKPGMVEDIVAIMAQHGFFRWGGRWTTPIDYQHFEVPRTIGELLLAMDIADGRRFLEILIQRPVVSNSNFTLDKSAGKEILDVYNQDAVRFFDVLPELLNKFQTQA